MRRVAFIRWISSSHSVKVTWQLVIWEWLFVNYRVTSRQMSADRPNCRHMNSANVRASPCNIPSSYLSPYTPSPPAPRSTVFAAWYRVHFGPHNHSVSWTTFGKMLLPLPPPNYVRLEASLSDIHKWKNGKSNGYNQSQTGNVCSSTVAFNFVTTVSTIQHTSYVQ